MHLRILLFSATMMLLLGCRTTPSTSNHQNVDTKPTITAHENKDRAVLDWAAKIDASVDNWFAKFPAPFAAEIKAATEAQREEIRKAPAAQFSVILDALKHNELEYVKTISALRKQVEDLKNQSLREQARWLTWSGVALLGAFGVSIAFGQLAAVSKTWPLALLGVGCFGLAQLISHPWFLRSFIGLLIAAFAYAVYYVYDRHKDGRLRSSLEKKAAILGEIVPVLDDAYDSAADSVKAALDSNIFDRLKEALTKEQRAEVHTVRAENVTKE